ncbi:MAG: lipopolysaccharide biosynthesis protein [Bacteroidetes bacterium]|nr:lipopolysaccharide biosynthesis protein [Bacteroidota bacterium]
MFNNIIWDYIGRFGNYLVSFLISIVLTRLLSAEEFGIMAMVMVIITLASVFLDMGFNRAIIQQQQVTSLQLSTIFYINITISVLLMLICFFMAAPLAIFYKQPLIKPVFQVVSISFLLNGANLIPSALIYKQLKIRVNSFILLIGSVISGIVGIVMAYSGYGVWSLVAQSLLSSFIVLVLTAMYIRWKPTYEFNFSAIKSLWNYGSRMFASGMLDRLYTRLDSFIIGKLYSAGTLGYYYRAQSMEGFVRTFSAGSLMETLFPYIAKHQHDLAFIKQVFLRYLHFITFVSVGLCSLLFLISKDLFILLFTERWIFAAQLFQLMIIGGIVWPISSLMVNIISGIGNSKAYFRLEVFKKIILLPVYIFGFIWGLKGFIISYIIAFYVCLLLNMIFVKLEIHVKLKEQAGIMLPYIIVGVAAAYISWLLVKFTSMPSHLIRTIIFTSLFTGLYLAGVSILKLNGFEIVHQMLGRVKNLIKKNKNA